MITWCRSGFLLRACVLSAAGVVVALSTVSPAVAAPVPASGTYHATPPTRILDTRSAVGVSAAGAIAAGHEAILQVTGRAPVPAGATAAVLNVTVTAPTGSGFVTVYPDGGARPATSNVNFVRNQTVPNLVVVSVPVNGKVRLYNGSGGSVQLIADVSGYFTGANAPSGQGAFGALAPRRLLDTRGTIAAPRAAIAARGSVGFTVTGNGVSPGVSAVVLNVTVTHPTSSGFITAYPSGVPIPTASNLNFLSKSTVPNLVVVPVGGDGKVALYNGSPGTVHLLADISGYFLAGDPVSAGALGALAPVRLLDTRSGIGGARSVVGPKQSRTLSVRGRGGVPLESTRALFLNVTVAAPTGAGYLTVYGGTVRPVVSNLNFGKGQTVPNLVVTSVSASGTVTFYNGSTGSVQIMADVSGYIPNYDAPLPATSTSRYVRNITGATTDAATMQNEGCSDAHAGSTFVLLVIGAQSVSSAPSANGTVLSVANPGVRLTVLEPAVRLTYAQLRAAVDAYTLGYTTCALVDVTVAVGTNNDGHSAAYPAATKGADWANEVVDKLAPRTHVTLRGAIDVEAGFGGTAADAVMWERSYLGATTADLVYAGSADGCPSTFGSAAAACGAVVGQVGTWTRADYSSLTHGLSPGRITALPQIYYAYQAVQWANINATAGNRIIFAGALTENASGCGADCAMTPSQGWAALFHATSTVVTVPSIPVVTDLRVDP